jgi:hypothetical protein
LATADRRPFLSFIGKSAMSQTGTSDSTVVPLW